MRDMGRIILIAVFSVLFVFGSLAAPAARAGQGEQGTITVRGEAVEMHAPDRVVISLALESSAKSAARAMRDNAERAEAMMGALKSMLDTGKGDTIKTSNFSVSPVYKSHGGSKSLGSRENRIAEHRARHSVIVSTGRINQAGQIIDRAMEAGANRIENVRFTLRQSKKHCESAMKAAAEEAKADARRIGALFGVKTAGIKSINPSCGSGGASPVMEMRAMAASGGPGLESGEVPVRAVVNVSYFIEQ